MTTQQALNQFLKSTKKEGRKNNSSNFIKGMKSARQVLEEMW